MRAQVSTETDEQRNEWTDVWTEDECANAGFQSWKPGSRPKSLATM